MKMSENINELATALVVAQGLIQNPTKSLRTLFQVKVRGPSRCH
jgi:hypothetical protein